MTTLGKLCLSGNDIVMVYEMSGKTTVKRADFHSYERIFQVMTTSVRHIVLLYDWRESCFLIGPICLHKSLYLPQNWSKLAQKVI